VYRNFEDAEEFAEVIRELAPHVKPKPKPRGKA
jgi:transcriptional regulator NrdR family protein